MAVSMITPTRLLPDRLSMLVELNVSLQNNDCLVVPVVIVDGVSQGELPHELCERAAVLAAGRPIGQAAARNLGLVIAKAEWITSADGDDWIGSLGPSFSSGDQLG